MLSLENYSKVITKEEFWNEVPRVMYYMDEPSGDASAVALYFVAKEAAKHVKVVLSGEGSDEFFGGYNIYGEPEALKWISWIPLKLRRKIAHMAEHFPDMKGRDYLIRGGIPIEERYIGNAHIFNIQEIKQLLKNNTDVLSSEEVLKDQYEKNAGLENMSRMQQIDINNWLPGDILQKADRMSMANSLELRVPYLDYDVFEFARKLPERAKIRKRQYFQVDKLVELLEEHVKEKRDNSRKIWTAYMFLVWYQVYFQ